MTCLSEWPRDQIKAFYVGNNKQTKWLKQSPCLRIVNQRANIVTEAVEPREPARNVTTLKEAFLSVFSRKTIDLILICTNKYINPIQNNFHRERDCRIVSYDELLQLQNTLIMKIYGLLIVHKIDFFFRYNELQKVPFIFRNAPFDSRTTREARQAIRDFSNLLNDFSNIL